MKFFEIATYVGAALGLLILLVAFRSKTDVGVAAGAALAVAFVVIPYCVASVRQRAAMVKRERDGDS